MLDNKQEEVPRPIFIDERRVGNTTRIIDYLIQKLFIEGECYCYDHYRNTTNPDITARIKEHTFGLVLRRLNFEHHIDSENLIIDRKYFTIKLKNP